MIVLGRIAAPFGVVGWLRLHPFGDDPASWRRMPCCWLAPDPESKDWTAYALAGIRQQGGGWVIKLDGVDDRTAAEALGGRYLAAPREDLPPTGEDEHYWADLIGLDVVNEQGQVLGKVATLIETGANAVLVVRAGDKEHLLPYIAQVVKKVDAAGARRITVDWGTDW